MTRQILVNAVAYDVFIPTDASGNVRYPGLSAADFTAISILNGEYSILTIQDGNGIPNTSLNPGVLYIEESSIGTGIYNLRFYPSSIGFQFNLITFTAESTETRYAYSITPNLYGVSDGTLVN